MSWAPAPLRRLALSLVAIVAFVCPSLVTLWVATPSADGIQQKLRDRTAQLGVILLKEDDVPPLLADAVIAIEDESFYSHHGIDSAQPSTTLSPRRALMSHRSIGDRRCTAPRRIWRG